MSLPIIGVAGLPRSGSTLLLQILGQNPATHVTPTSGVCILAGQIQKQWATLEPFRAQGLGRVSPRVQAGIAGFMQGFFLPEISEGKTVFDKSRAWPAHIELVEAAFGQPMKVILCVRDLMDILASFERLHRRNVMHTRAQPGLTVEQRARNYLVPESVVGSSLAVVRDAYMRGLEDRFLVVPFNRLCNNPQSVLDMLHAQLGLDDFEYDLENVKQITHEDDTVFGFPAGSLHSIREGPIRPPNSNWRQIYPEPFGQTIIRNHRLVAHLNRTEPTGLFPDSPGVALP